MEMLNNLFTIRGYVPHGGFALFWTSPVGFTVCTIIFITSLYKIFASKTDLVLSAFEYVMAFCAVASLLHIYENTVPKHQMVTMVIAIAIKRLYELYLDWRNR